MQTFEDFFAKKKIDLRALENDNKGLYEEFYQHYHAMGEKSFDHTKKFWFNKLRKSYKLDESLSSVQKADLQEKPATTATPVPSTFGFKPKFTAKPILKEDVTGTDKTESTAEIPDIDSKPTGFKPRFKAGVTKITTTESTEKPTEQKAPEENPGVENKPSGFKPRFKAGVTKTTTTESTEKPTEQKAPEENPGVENKPSGFKPRFKAGVTKTTTTESTEKPTEQKAPEENPGVENKPSGFKPRFKAGVTKVKNEGNSGLEN